MTVGTDDLTEGTSASVDAGSWEVDYRRAISAKELLHQELVAAGVTGMVPQINEDGPEIGILVGPLTTDAVVSLSDLLHTAMHADYAALTTLRGAFEQHGVEVPHLSLRERRLDFSEVGIASANRLASSLGSPAPEGTDLDDLDHWPTAQAVVERLEAAVKAVTGRILSAVLLPECSRCSTAAAVKLGSLDIEAAKKLLAVLVPGEER